MTRRESISREDALVKFDQLVNRKNKLDADELKLLNNLRKLLHSNLTFSKITTIKETPPRTPFVYCFEVDQGLPGIVVDGNIFTHNCFGYTGYKNARFGRIECHESITAYGREILLDAKEVAEECGYNVLHGIVDSLWVTTNGAKMPTESAALREAYSELCAAVTGRTGIDIEFEGFYRWIVFLPNKSTGVGALTRYYGLLDSGKFKVRGIELRQRSTPKFFMSFQKELLDTLANARTKHELEEIVKTDAMDVLRRYAGTLLRGECTPQELVFATRVTRELG